MKTLLEKAIIETLNVYIRKRGIKQNELAIRLGWSTSDLNDTLKGRKSIGKNRQAFLEEKLGEAFRHELLLKISELSEAEKKKPAKIAESPAEYIVDKYILTDSERNYVEKLLGILRGINQRAKIAIKVNIDALYHYKKEKLTIEKGYIRQLLGK